MKRLAARLRRALRDYGNSLFARTIPIAQFLETRMIRMALIWLCCTIPLALWKFSNTPSVIHDLGDAMPIVVGYTLVILAPCAGYWIARGAFLGERSLSQPTTRFAIFGRWRRLERGSAEINPAFGIVGFMVSLLIGLLLNVVMRTGEYFVAVPAMSAHAPEWGRTMFLMMTAEVVITSFFYMVCFVMALRKIPLFPRMLLFAWSVDILMQLHIANQLAEVGGLPASVAEPLTDLLNGNVTKVLISAAVWLPYLLLSERVNVTYRHRTAAD
ncbi:DUF2569 family protein [Erythrobacter ani]|uniref:DUF2569 family protein n=1 Tax=Erythrobacter ani TaxID=2827235 RepID=A0ABS6SLC4_9SPHN|nr:DUF2569 family protein [Erythrobacter ani]MBV7265864.1 DUF2569 family protein [Erythrobacter ani]